MEKLSLGNLPLEVEGWQEQLVEKAGRYLMAFKLWIPT